MKFFLIIAFFSFSVLSAFSAVVSINYPKPVGEHEPASLFFTAFSRLQSIRFPQFLIFRQKQKEKPIFSFNKIPEKREEALNGKRIIVTVVYDPSVFISKFQGLRRLSENINSFVLFSKLILPLVADDVEVMAVYCGEKIVSPTERFAHQLIFSVNDVSRKDCYAFYQLRNSETIREEFQLP